jgi:hypothetical protein
MKRPKPTQLKSAKKARTVKTIPRPKNGVGPNNKRKNTAGVKSTQLIKSKTSLQSGGHLYTVIRKMVIESRSSVAAVVNQELTLLYWNIGAMIMSDMLKKKRANYGEQIISNLSSKMSEEFGKGWSKQQLWN